MLVELRIRDFAIIDELDLRLGPGFVAFTGETGAGKSIIIDAVELLLGGRADSTMVRTGADAALIEATFQIEPGLMAEIQPILEREELDDDPGFLVLAREVRREGRNLARVNGRSSSVGLLRELGENLVDVHGQSEHLSLLRVPQHLHLLDRYARAQARLAAYKEYFVDLQRVRAEMKSLREKEAQAARRTEFLTYQVEEVEAAALQAEEEAELLAERNRLANAERLADQAELAVAALDEGLRGESAATDLVGQAIEALQELAELDPSMAAMRDEAQALMESLGDIARRLRVYREDIEHNPTRLDEVEERLALIAALKRKYGGTIEAVLASTKAARQELEDITHVEERLERLQAEEARALEGLGRTGQELSETRRAASDDLRASIERELEDLYMQGARFGVQLEWLEDPDGVALDGRQIAFHPNGLDEVEFLVAPNPGEGLKPLVKIASGGETSRLMLGLKSVLAEADRTPTLIFDEIDQGIGGRVGAVVGRKLWRLARDHQVLCVTHLPQLAAFGDEHIKVEKLVESGRTLTRVRPLEGGDRQAELAQMLGGESGPNLESAATLMREAEGEKAAAAAG